MKIAFLLIAIFFNVSVFGQPSAKPVNERFEMKTYYMVFLKKGPVRNQDSIVAGQIQKEHLAYLTKMYDDGKTCIAGPFLEDGDIRGICVYNTETIEEAKRLAENDPGVKSGRLIVEVHPWYAAKGTCLK